GLGAGRPVRLGVGIGAALVVAPRMKGTGFALSPAAALAVAVMLWRKRRAAAWIRPAAALAATGTALFAAWAAIGPAFHRDAITTPGGTAPGSSTAAFHH